MTDWNDLWRDTDGDPPEVDFDAIRTRAETLSRQITRRNRIETGAGVFVVVSFFAFGLIAPSSEEAMAHFLVALGGAVVTGIVYWKGTAGDRTATPHLETTAYLVAHRAELKHQIRLLRWVPVWYLGPLVPGLLAMAFTHHANPWNFLAMAGAVGAGITALNLFAAHQLRARLTRLPAVDG